MRFQQIIEANIPVREIEREARRVINPQIRQYLEGVWDKFMADYPDATSEERHQLYDDWYEGQWRDPETRRTLIKVTCNQPGVALAKLVRERTKEQCQVHVICREYTDLAASKDGRGGDFHYNSGVRQYTIRIFVDEVVVQETISGRMQEIVFGDGEELDLLTNQIVPIFIHEFTHLEQELRNPKHPMKNGNDRDRGITKAGGGKFGSRRNPSGGNVQWARYIGSLDEIEAFASQAASDMIRKSDRWGNEPDTSYIDNLLTDLASGWGHGRAFDTVHHLKVYWDEFEKAGITKKERDLVWKRFLKLTYQKIWQYRREQIGKVPAWQQSTYEKAPRSWQKMAKKGMVECIYQIVHEVVFETGTELGWKTPEEIANRDPLVSKGIDFVESYFFGDQDYNSTKSLQIRVAMRSMVQRQLERELERQREEQRRKLTSVAA